MRYIIAIIALITFVNPSNASAISYQTDLTLSSECDVTALYCDQGRMFVGQTEANELIRCYNTSSDNLLFTTDVSNIAASLDIVPVDMALSPDGSCLYVATMNPSMIFSIDTISGSVLTYKEISSSPYKVLCDTIDGSYYIFVIDMQGYEAFSSGLLTSMLDYSDEAISLEDYAYNISDDILYLLDFSGAIIAFEYDGSSGLSSQVYSTSTAVTPYSCDIGPNGEVLVCSTEDGSIWTHDKYLTTYSTIPTSLYNISDTLVSGSSLWISCYYMPAVPGSYRGSLSKVSLTSGIVNTKYLPGEYPLGIAGTFDGNYIYANPGIPNFQSGSLVMDGASIVVMDSNLVVQDVEVLVNGGSAANAICVSNGKYYHYDYIDSCIKVYTM